MSGGISLNPDLTLHAIARIRTDFTTKFGLPRQSGLAGHLTGRVVFEEAYRDRNALRGLEDFSHLWLIWGFSETARDSWKPTVRPPRMGGNRAVGVFATRSPFRPNPLALSCVKLIEIEETQSDGATLLVSGVDMMDGTPIYDIKPYIPYADSRPDASGGFTDDTAWQPLRMRNPDALKDKLTDAQRLALIEALSQDPRPAYRRNDTTPFGLTFAKHEIKFRVVDGAVEVLSID